MQIVRTIAWVALLIVFVALTLLNWDITLAMRIWPGIVWDTRLPAIVTVAFLLGLVPMWLIHRGSKWRLQRRVTALEAAARPPVAAPSAAPPATPPAVPPGEPLSPDRPASETPLPPHDETRG
jgi:hypothetical protein